jgi:hypothetical protein
MNYSSSPTPTPFVDQSPFSATLDTARNVIIVFLVGIALVVSLLVLAYVTTVIADRCCGCCFRYPPSEGGSMDHGPVSRKANLWGLSQAERARILPHLFKKTSFLWSLEQEGASTEGASTSNTTTSTSNDDPPTELQTPAATLQVLDDDDVRACCSICLTAFEPGVRVMTGTTCTHVFHEQCCMKWLLSQHDHCPYCRQEFMTAPEMRQAAIAVLGSARVRQLGLPGVQATATTQSLELPTIMRPGQETTSLNEELSGGLQEPDVVDVEAGGAERGEEAV